ncbi:hypothetical protein SAMN05444273_10251 [Litoreibacter ascidiaceicola]|uniref:Uncharacterized protein n=1 Tax=Litoreibacter ascidiaceicola TaxID=1486859 RepID=A0A1M4UWV0_9RHOB|nr:hypothetical protein [Litoreibacter ascidiaceicola]SHE61110.1 hypothetical protein SAMN05444273_10251 [Litoreibacter ascidiaceicola]
MSNLIPLGAVITMMGLLGLIWCIYKVARARKQGLSDEELRAVMQTTVGLNLGALLLSAVGLMMVVLGIILA